MAREPRNPTWRRIPANADAGYLPQRGRVKGINDDAFFDPLPAAELKAWEIATKHRIGKLPGVESAVRQFNELLIADSFGHLAISHQHALMAGGFAINHRDPFDRMLAAQAIIEGATLVTDDAAMKLFRVKCLW